MSQVSQIEERALLMLGSGAPASIVASALGVTEGRISQMLADEEFAQQVSELRFRNLQRSTLLDEKYTGLEEALLEKLTKVMPLMTKPRDVLTAINVVNGAKRRGAQVQTDAGTQKQIVNLTIPISIAHKFVSNVNNQVIEVQDGQGDARSLVTATSGSLDRLAKEVLGSREGASHELATYAPKELLESPCSATAPERPEPSSSGKGRTSGPISVEDLL